jgi:hypothetical protein
LNDEWRIGEDEIETVVEVLWDLLLLVEIVLEIVWIVLSKFLIELYFKINLRQIQKNLLGFISHKRCLGLT